MYWFAVGGNVAEKGIVNATVLAIIAPEDQTSLSNLFVQSTWKVVFTSSFLEAKSVLGEDVPGVVICDGRLPDGNSWKDLLHEMRKMQDPPPLIVADRLADDRLWAEALNLGAYDLLAKPFDGKEVWHAVTTACRSHENKQAIPKPETAEPGRSNSKGAMGAGSTPRQAR